MKINNYLMGDQVSGYKQFYKKHAKKVTRCPTTAREGQPLPGNPLVWFVEYKDQRGHKKISRWSYATGRAVSPSAEDTNVV
jgi:hypothetical protein